MLLLLTLGWSSAYIEDDIESLQQNTQFVFRTMKNQHFYNDQRARTVGFSGIKAVRQRNHGTQSYYSESHVGDSIFNIHSHADRMNTAGIGEFDAVLNGNEFRARHADYKLLMKSRTSQVFGATEPISYPGVPQAVLDKASLNEQVEEMKLWYKAFKDQDYSVRDYRPYFQANLCYLEGMTTGPNMDGASDNVIRSRHSLNAHGWEECHKKTIFNSYSGNMDEKLANLPSSVIDVTNKSVPIMGQFNYQILCHPLGRDLPLNRFRVVDDLQTRIRKRRTKEDHEKGEFNDARYRLCSEDSDDCGDGFTHDKFTLLDQIMEDIPGMNNYNNELIDGFDRGTFNFTHASKALFSGYYHRKYLSTRTFDFGTTKRTKTFNDVTSFFAMTDSPHVASETFSQFCYIDSITKETICKEISTSRWTYAIPLEIIYTHPLNTWNPHQFQFWDETEAATVNANRTGGFTDDKAFNGTSAMHYYLTPLAMFSGSEVNQDPADTVTGPVAVLNSEGEQKSVYASGIRILLPEIPGVGKIRTRYPIAPVHAEGNTIWKEVTALKDLLEKAYDLDNMFPNGHPFEKTDIILRMRPSGTYEEITNTPHVHLIKLTAENSAYMRKGDKMTIITTEPASHGDNHTHLLRMTMPADTKKFRFIKCDNRYACEHPNEIDSIEGVF